MRNALRILKARVIVTWLILVVPFARAGEKPDKFDLWVMPGLFILFGGLSAVPYAALLGIWAPFVYAPLFCLLLLFIRMRVMMWSAVETEDGPFISGSMVFGTMMMANLFLPFMVTMLSFGIATGIGKMAE